MAATRRHKAGVGGCKKRDRRTVTNFCKGVAEPGLEYCPKHCDCTYTMPKYRCRGKYTVESRKLAGGHCYCMRHAIMGAPKDTMRRVLPERDVIFKYRKGKDVYTLKEKKHVLARNPERDHVVECQVVDAAWATVLEGNAYKRLPPAMRTRSNKSAIVKVHNSTVNLNVTTAAINKGKWPPFQKFVRRHYSSRLRSVNLRASRHAAGARDAIDDDTWENIDTLLRNTWDAMAQSLKTGAPAGGAANPVSLFVAEMDNMVDKMFE